MRIKLFHIYIFILSVLVIIGTAGRIDAISNPSGIILSPAFTSISPGSSYLLTIQNTTPANLNLMVSPQAFSVDNIKHNLTPLKNNLDLTKYITIINPAFALAPGKTRQINIKYLASIPDVIVGVVVKNTDISTQQIGVVGQLASVIISTTLANNDLKNITQTINLNPKLEFFGINLGTQVGITTNISNQTDKFISIGADVTEYSSITRLNQVLLTNQLPTSIYPKQMIAVNAEITDNRPFWKRIGYANYVQNIDVQGQTLTISKKILSIPFELIVLISALALVSFYVSYNLFKRLEKRRNVAE